MRRGRDKVLPAPALPEPTALGGAGRFLSSLAEAAVVADERGVIVFVNDGVTPLLGWDPGSLCGLDLTTIVPERLRRAHQEAFARYAAGGEGRIFGRAVRLRALHRDGSEVEVELFLSPGPTPGTVLAMLRDTRSRIDLEAQTAVSHELLHVLADVAQEGAGAPRLLQAIAEGIGWEAAGLWVVDRQAQRLRCDGFWAGPRDALERFRATTEATLLPPGVGLPGRVWASSDAAWIVDLGADANFPRAAAAEAAGLRSGMAFPVVARGRLLGVVELFDGRVHEEDRSLLETMLGVGELVGQLLERLWHDEERERLLGLLHRERARLQAVQRRMPAGVVVADAPSGRIVSGNDMLDELIGPALVTEQDGEPIYAYRFCRADGSEYPQAELPFVRAARSGEVAEGAEMDLLGADGEVRLVSVSAAPVRDPAGQIISAVATFHDVTARRRTEDRHRFLSEASAALVESLDLVASLEAVARLAIGVLGESVGVYLVGPDGQLHEAAVAFADESMAEVAGQLRARYGYDPDAGEGVARVLRTGETVVYDTVEPALLDLATDAEHLALLRRLQTRSAMLIPVTSAHAVIGVLTFSSVRPGDLFDPGTVALAEELGRRIGTSVANVRVYERERDLASTLQASLLPERLPDLGWLDLAARFHAGGEGLEVGGDCYDVFPCGPEAVALVVGDVCGKGSEAAARTAEFRYTTRALSGVGRDPATVLSLVDAKVRETDQPDSRFCTAVYATMDRRPDGVLCTASSAGHPLPYVVRFDGPVEQLPCPGSLLFMVEHSNHQNAATLLRPGDALVLYTDGVTEARGEHGWFGEERLEALLASCAGKSAETIASTVADAALAFSGGRAADDVALLVAACR